MLGCVSIPQSGFGAFEQHSQDAGSTDQHKFQSLSRDSGRLNRAGDPRAGGFLLQFQSLSRDSGRLNFEPVDGSFLSRMVSIPQSGFGAFELHLSDESLARRVSVSFNPSVGIRGV